MIIAAFCAAAALMRWKLFSKTILLAPMKPDKKPYIMSAMEEFPETPNELKALLALERFNAGTIATRVILALAGLLLTMMIFQQPHWMLIVIGILLIYIYAKLLAPDISLLDQAIDEISYVPINEPIDMKDFLPPHLSDLEKTANLNASENDEIPDMPESPPVGELAHLQKTGDLSGIARFAWLDLSRSENRCRDFDYFPHGGMRSFYCHLKNYCSYGFVSKNVGMSVFLSDRYSF